MYIHVLIFSGIYYYEVTKYEHISLIGNIHIVIAYLANNYLSISGNVIK